MNDFEDGEEEEDDEEIEAVKDVNTNSRGKNKTKFKSAYR